MNLEIINESKLVSTSPYRVESRSYLKSIPIRYQIARTGENYFNSTRNMANRQIGPKSRLKMVKTNTSLLGRKILNEMSHKKDLTNQVTNSLIKVSSEKTKKK